MVLIICGCWLGLFFNYLCLSVVIYEFGSCFIVILIKFLSVVFFGWNSKCSVLGKRLWL